MVDGLLGRQSSQRPVTASRLIFVHKKLVWWPTSAMESGANETWRNPPYPNAGRKEESMDWSSIEQNWKQVRRKIKEKWEKLSDEDLDAINGRRDRLEEKIQTRYGFAPNYIHKEVEDWLRWQHPRPAELARRETLRF
jgi:uncharacterized protein YjbJ (UPF0337 family)